MAKKLVPVALYEALLERYPDMVSDYRDFLSAKRKGALHWPDWCYMPVAAAFAVVNPDDEFGRTPMPTAQQVVDVRNVAATMAWAKAKAIYRFSPEIFPFIKDMGDPGDLPHDAIETLPVHCPYIQFPQDSMPGIDGFFVHWDYEPDSGHRELRFILTNQDLETALIYTEIGNGTIWEGMQRVAQRDEAKPILKQMAKELNAVIVPKLDDDDKKVLVVCMNCLLYICSQAADIEKRPVVYKNRNRRVSSRQSDFASSPSIYNVGYRLGTRLNAQIINYVDAAEPSTSGRTYAAHMRRAHYHHYWTGPRDGERTLIVRWLPPIPVNMDWDEEPDLPRITTVD